MRIAVIGSSGHFGSEIVRLFQESGRYETIPITHQELECTSRTSVQSVLTRVGPDLVINCAALARLDDCEELPKEAFLVNGLGAFNVAGTCAQLGARCIFVSTDNVFGSHGEAPYSELDSPAPVNLYGLSKLCGEGLVRSACDRSLIVRVASLFGMAHSQTRGNFIETMRQKAVAGEDLRVVNDLRMSPTYAAHAIWALQELIDQNATGTVHVTNGGDCSWYELASKFLEHSGLAATSIEPITAAEFGGKAVRPKNSALTSVVLPGYLQKPLPSWEEALMEYLDGQAGRRSRPHTPQESRTQST